MLCDYAAAKVTFVAPTIWHYEGANIVNKAVGTQRLSEEEGYLAFQALQALDIECYRLSYSSRSLQASTHVST
jgi:hypothetical protein